MIYTAEMFLRDLKCDREWNEIAKDAQAAGLALKEIEPVSLRKEVADAFNQYFYNRCPQEMKDHPEIHFEVAKRK